MCGIFAYVGWRNPIPILLEGLSLLEYRGYDSAGVAVHHGNEIHRFRCQGKLSNLISAIADFRPAGRGGIGHTRWATHGRPNEANAHPHIVNGIAVVHNGIIENHVELRRELEHEGCCFSSETDTEIFCHLFASKICKGQSLVQAIMSGLKRVLGSYALAVIARTDPDLLIVARKESPIVIGIAEGEAYVASDITALLPFTKQVLFLEDEEIAQITAKQVQIETLSGVPVERKPQKVDRSFWRVARDGYPHFMLNEIFEQPSALRRTLAERLVPDRYVVELPQPCLDFYREVSPKRIVCVACGTSYYAGLVGKFVLEHCLGVPVEVDLASEFRYRPPLINSETLVICVSQSGETADTIGALREAKTRGAATLGICNVYESTLARECDSVFYTHTGPEIGVASTKAFTGQLAAFLLLALGWSDQAKCISAERSVALGRQLASVPDLLARTFEITTAVEELAQQFSQSANFLYLGRGALYPIALEGALKLKEVSYVHAEGCPAGEIKHGPIALVDENMPVFVLAQRDHVFAKILSNMQEISSRGGQILAVTDDSIATLPSAVVSHLKFPTIDWLLAPFLAIVPLQLFAYHVAVARGLDVDKPRNLAKSVTVE
jgi:glucosamine--fructose-6-phosphate aminotransferase (isomerizing)